MFRMHWNNFRDQPGASRIYSRVSRFGGRPAWVWGIAFFVGLLPALFIIALLLLAGLLVTAVAYMILSTLHELVSRITGSTSRAPTDGPFDDDNFRGRRNVRVISPNHSE